MIKQIIKNKLVHKLAVMLNLTNELSDEEKLTQFINEQKHATLLDRIKAIRTNSYYIPNYNKPKSFTDVIITYNNGETYIPISDRTLLSSERPIDFGNNIKIWKKVIRLDHKKELKEKQQSILNETNRKKLINEVFAFNIMRNMMQVN